MSSFTSALIDALGGTTEVARLMDAPMSTVHRMRTEPTPSRINHLRRVAHMEQPSLDIAALAAGHGVMSGPIPSARASAAGKTSNVTDAEVSA